MDIMDIAVATVMLQVSDAMPYREQEEDTDQLLCILQTWREAILGDGSPHLRLCHLAVVLWTWAVRCMLMK